MGELAKFDDMSNDDVAFHGTEGDLTFTECQLLEAVARYSPEILERDKTKIYLEWGKYLVQNCVVSDYTDEEGNNIPAPDEPNNEPLVLPPILVTEPLKRKGRKVKGFWVPPEQ